MSRIVFAALVVLPACGAMHVEPDAGSGGSDGGHDTGLDAGLDAPCALTLCDEHNPCETTSCAPDGGCVRTVSPEGTICLGNATDPIHGECNGDPVAPSCGVTEWTCLRNPPGTACIGGFCDVNQTCCSGGCIDSKTGACAYGPSGGHPCPVP